MVHILTAQEPTSAVISPLLLLTRTPHSGQSVTASLNQLLWLHGHHEMDCRLPEISHGPMYQGIAMPQLSGYRSCPKQSVQLRLHVECLLARAAQGLVMLASLIELLWLHGHCGIYGGLP